MYVSTHVSLFCVCIVFVFCYMLLSKEEIKKEEDIFLHKNETTDFPLEPSCQDNRLVLLRGNIYVFSGKYHKF